MSVDPEKNDIQFFFDSLEEFLKKTGSRLKFLSRKGTAETALAYHSGLIRIKISSRQKEIESHYLALGEYFFRQKGKVTKDDEIVKGHFNNIITLEKEIANYEAEIARLQKECDNKLKKEGTEKSPANQDKEAMEEVEPEIIPPPPIKKNRLKPVPKPQKTAAKKKAE